MAVTIPLRIDLTLTVADDGTLLVAAPPVVTVEPTGCTAMHPVQGRCALPAGHDGAHDPAPAPQTAEGVEDAPVTQETPADRGEAVERPTRATPSASPTGRITPAQKSMLFATWRALDYSDDQLDGREERLRVTSALVGREVESTNDLTKAEARRLIDALAPCSTRMDVERVVDATLAHTAGASS